MGYEKRYPSRHKPGTFITVGQWLGELMCERKAMRETKELPRAFWKKIHEDKGNNKDWQKYLKLQTQHAYKLLKEFDEKHLVQAVTNHRTLYSLLPKWVKTYISNYKYVEETKKPSSNKKEIKSNPQFNTRLHKKKNLLDSLEDD